MVETLPVPNKDFIALHNVFFDKWLKEINGNECLILMFIIRKTLGWQKRTDWISLSQFEKNIKLSRKTIIKSIKSLVNKGMIFKKVTGIQGKEKIYYSLNCDKKPTSVKSTRGENLHPTSVKSTHTKDNITKNNIIIDEQSSSVNNSNSVDNFSKEKIKENKSRINNFLKMVGNEKIQNKDMYNCKLRYRRELKSICQLMRNRGWCEPKICAEIFKDIANSLLRQYGDKLATDSFYYALFSKVPVKYIDEKAEVISRRVKEVRGEII